jgi:transcriptional regulator with XRE-family HTH domain
MSYHNLTLRDIAAATRNAVSTVGTWKNGRVPSSRAARARLAEVFRVSEEYLLTGQRVGGRLPVGEEAAGRILDDLELLVRELEAHERRRG